MENIQKILVLDNEEMVLETIEMFYPSEDITLFTASSLDKGLKILSEEKPAVLVTHIKLRESTGRELIEKLRNISKDVEIVAMADLDQFKDVLAEFGKDISDVVYKPIDMDILEIIIKRAQERFSLKIQMRKIQQDFSSSKDEVNNLNSQIMNLQNQADLYQKEVSEIKEQLAAFKNNASAEISGQTEIFQKQLEEGKKQIALQKNFGISLIAAFRKSSGKTKLPDIFSEFEECLQKTFNTRNCRIEPCEMNNYEKVQIYQDILKNNKFFYETSGGIEIPFKISSSLYVIVFSDKVDISPCIHLFHILKDILEFLARDLLVQRDYSVQLEKEKAKSGTVCTILANIQMYMKKSEAIEKIKNTREDLSKTSGDILDLIFNSQDCLDKQDEGTKTKIDPVIQNLNRIISEKSQNFDILNQKVSQVIDLVNNIQAGLEGKRMQQVSGDQFLFSKDRKKI